MDEIIFMDIINEYGEENILGFGFDNTGGIVFTPDRPFKLATCYNPKLKSLVLVDCDINNRDYYTIKPVATIQSVMIKHPNVSNKWSYDHRSIRG